MAKGDGTERHDGAAARLGSTQRCRSRSAGASATTGSDSACDTSEARLAEVRRELEGKIEELARANLDLYETARRKSEFVANMSHELRTPLNSIIGFADVLLAQMKDSASPEQLNYLKNIRQGGYRLLEILSELLDFSRLESGRTRLRAGPVAIGALVRETASRLAAASARNVCFEVDCPDEMPTVMADEVKIAQVLQNLGGNAVKFTPDGGYVRFGARLDGKTLTLIVSDSGIGIAEKDQAAVFERFHQADGGPARRHDGVGLGLYIVDGLVRLMGGKIALESAPGRGSTFTVTIPVEIVEI